MKCRLSVGKVGSIVLCVIIAHFRLSRAKPSGNVNTAPSGPVSTTLSEAVSMIPSESVIIAPAGSVSTTPTESISMISTELVSMTAAGYVTVAPSESASIVHSESVSVAPIGSVSTSEPLRNCSNISTIKNTKINSELKYQAESSISQVTSILPTSSFSESSTLMSLSPANSSSSTLPKEASVSQNSVTNATSPQTFSANNLSLDSSAQNAGDASKYFDYYYEEFSDLDEDAPFNAHRSTSRYLGVDGGNEASRVPSTQQAPPGLNRVAKLRLIKTPRREPPEYMLELYDRFSKGSADFPTVAPSWRLETEATTEGHDGREFDLGADIVRSFPNINKEATDEQAQEGDENSSNTESQQEERQQLPGIETRHHTLVFNITSLLNGEEVSRAELRLFTLMEHDRNTYLGLDRVVKVYDGLQPRETATVPARSAGDENIVQNEEGNNLAESPNENNDAVNASSETQNEKSDVIQSPSESNNETNTDVEAHREASREGKDATEAPSAGASSESSRHPGGINGIESEPVVSRHVFGATGGWEAFDVTEVVRSWVRRGRGSVRGAGKSTKVGGDSEGRVKGDVKREGGDNDERKTSSVVTGGPGVDGVYILDVSIDSIFVNADQAEPKQREANGTHIFKAMDIDVDPEHDQGPLLVVFSKDIGASGSSSRRSSSSSSRSSSSPLQQQRDLQEVINHEPLTDAADSESGGTRIHTTPRPSTTHSDDLLPSLSSHSKHLPYNNLTQANSRELFLPVGLPEDVDGSVRRVRSRSRRDTEDNNSNAIPRKKRNSCRRKKMYVDFQAISWEHWIIAPPGYMAFECVGKCYVPIGQHLSPTKHAIIQTLMHAAHPKKAARACCVPTKLDPISILYLDENGVLTYKYHYEGMVVAECGCR